MAIPSPWSPHANSVVDTATLFITATVNAKRDFAQKQPDAKNREVKAVQNESNTVDRRVRRGAGRRGGSARGRTPSGWCLRRGSRRAWRPRRRSCGSGCAPCRSSNRRLLPSREVQSPPVRAGRMTPFAVPPPPYPSNRGPSELISWRAPLLTQRFLRSRDSVTHPPPRGVRASAVLTTEAEGPPKFGAFMPFPLGGPWRVAGSRGVRTGRLPLRG